MGTSARHERPATGARNAATRDLLVDTAIKLFAERGLLGVSLRAVGEAAGQRNTGVVHHHFGDRETLLDAALDRVLAAVREPVDHATARRLGLSIIDPATPLHRAVGLAFLPLLTLPLRHPDWGEAGARLLGRVMLGEAAALARELEAKTLGDMAEMVALFGPLLPDLPEPLLRTRLDLATVSVVCGLTASAYVSALASSKGSGGLAAPEMTDPLLHFVAAGLAGPPHKDRLAVEARR